MSGKGQKEACANFEPQAWRKNLCKNCFKTKPEHSPRSETGQPAQAHVEVKSPPVLSAKIAKTEPIAAAKAGEKTAATVNTGKQSLIDTHTLPTRAVQRVDDKCEARSDIQTQDDRLLDECTVPVATAVAAAFASSAKTKFTGKAAAKTDDSLSGSDTGRFISGVDGGGSSQCKVSPAQPGAHSVRGTDVSQSSGTAAAVVSRAADPCAPEISQPTDIQHVTAGDTKCDTVTPDKTTVVVTNTGSKSTADSSSLDSVNNLKNTELVYHATEQDSPVFISASHGTTHEEFAQAKKELCAARRRQRRRRQSAGDIRRPPDGDELPPDGRVSMADVRAELNRKEAMREGARMLIDNMREKVIVLEDRCERLDREKAALGELLTAKKRDCAYLEDECAAKVATLEEQLRRCNAEKNRLVDRLRLPESERSSLTAGEQEIEALQRRLEESEQARRAALEDNNDLRQEVRDLQLEMDEMHDQFRDDEAIEFRELQKELETAAKNCRILQFKLRRTERRAEQLELERVQQGESLRRLEQHGGAATTSDSPATSAQVRDLQEDLRMAKEVSVRLHDELDLVEEKRARYEEELGRVNDLLTESECRRHNMQQELEMLEDQLRKRTECLENLLAEEREKLAAAEKKLKAKEGQTAKKDKALQEREKEIKDKEFSLCQRQLGEANDQIRDLKKTIDDLEKAQADSKSELDALTKELEAEKKKKAAGDAKEPRVKGSAASWRWEKQDLERQLKEARKKTDDLLAELKKTQRKTSADDGSKDNKTKDKANEKQLKELKDKCADLSKQLDEEKKRMEELQSRLTSKTKEWDAEKQQLENSRKSAEKEAKQKADAMKLKDDIVKQKDDVILQKDSAIRDRDKSLKEKTSLCQQKSDELETKTKQMKQKENELREAHAQLKDLNAQLLEREKRVKSVDEDVRKRDNRIKEKDEALEKLNRQFTEKENSVSDMDNTIRQVMRKLQERENDITQINQSLKTAEQQTTSANEKVRELKQKLETTERDRAKEKESLGKLESELELMKKEKSALLQELQKAKEQLKDKEDKWRKEKSKIELELKQAKGKMHSRDLSKTLRESDAIKALTDEKEALISEKHQLVNDNSKLKKESKNATKQWNSEREDLQKIIGEKTKLIEDNSAICARLEGEIKKLKTQLAQAASKSTPIPVLHESSADGGKNAWAKEKKELLDRLEKQQQTLTAEKTNVEESYAAKLRIAQDQCARAQDRVACLTKENEAQMELLQSSRRTISEVKQKYEGGATAWNKEKQYLEAKAKQLEQKKSVILDLEKELDDLKAASSLCTCAKQKPAAEKTPSKTPTPTPTKAPRAKLIPAKMADEPAAGSATKISAFRAKFEKFETPQKRSPVAPPTTTTTTTTPTTTMAVETKKAADNATTDDTDTLVKTLREQIEELQSLRKKDLQEGAEASEKRRKEWTKERKEYQHRLKELETRCTRLDELDAALVAVKCQSESAQQRAQEETRTLSRELDDAKREHLEAQQVTADLKAEVQKLKSVAPLLTGTQTPPSSDSPSTSRRSSRGAVSNRLPIGRADSAEQGKVRVIQVTKATGKRDKTPLRSTSEPADKTESEPRKVLDQFWRQQKPAATSRLGAQPSVTIKPGVRSNIEITRGFRKTP